MEKTNFENLEIYQLSERLADLIWEIVLTWPPIAQRTVGEQMIRSSDGIGANIAEGGGRGTAPDNRRFLRMGRGSLNETRHWLRRAHRRKLLTATHTEQLTPLLSELTPKLNAYLRKVDGTARGKSQL